MRPARATPNDYQDVEELLEAGINVYTTLNIQHIESLNDVVAQITGTNVRETVPDSVIDAVTDIELIDLPPDELINRLQEGKVYVPDQASARHPEILPQGQPDRLARIDHAARRRTGGRPDAGLYAHEPPFPAHGRPGNGCWSASALGRLGNA